MRGSWLLNVEREAVGYSRVARQAAGARLTKMCPLPSATAASGSPPKAIAPATFSEAGSIEVSSLVPWWKVITRLLDFGSAYFSGLAGDGFSSSWSSLLKSSRLRSGSRASSVRKVSALR